MYYDLDILEEYARELGFSPTRESSDVLLVPILDAVLLFWNLRSEEDTILGFENTEWHAHGRLRLETEQGYYVDLDELDVLQGIRDGDILIIELYRKGALEDRWLAHRKEKQDLQYMQPGEDIRIRRLA